MRRFPEYVLVAPSALTGLRADPVFHRNDGGWSACGTESTIGGPLVGVRRDRIAPTFRACRSCFRAPLQGTLVGSEADQAARETFDPALRRLREKVGRA